MFSSAIAVTRSDKSIQIDDWLQGNLIDQKEIWILIGPEGGWTLGEEELALKCGCVKIELGKSILRCITAAVSASQFMITYRRKNLKKIF